MISFCGKFTSRQLKDEVSSFRLVSNGSSMLDGFDISSQDFDSHLGWDLFARANESPMHSKIVTLDSNVPGFVPSFD